MRATRSSRGHGFFGRETVAEVGDTFFSFGDFRIDAADGITVSKGQMVVGCLEGGRGLVIGDQGRVFRADARSEIVMHHASRHICVDRHHVELRDWRGKFQLANGRCTFESFVTAGTLLLTAEELAYSEGDRWLAINGQTVTLNFPKRRAIVSLDGADQVADVKIDRVGITVKQAYLSVRFPGCRIFADRCGLVFRAGDAVLCCGDSALALRLGWSVFTFENNSISLRC